MFPSSRMTDKSTRILSENSEDLVKECRKANIHLICDTQSPFDMNDNVQDQFDLKFIFRLGRKEGDLVEMFNGIPSMDKERIKQIKRLRNFRFFISHPDAPLSWNNFQGITLDYKISDHLEKMDDEITMLGRKFPREEWYESKKYVDMLRSDWMRTYNKYKGNFERLHVEDQNKSTAKLMGIAASDYRVLIYFFDNAKKSKIKFKELQTNTGIPQGTMGDSLDRLEYKGLISRDGKKDGWIRITDSGRDFIKENEEKFQKSSKNG